MVSEASVVELSYSDLSNETSTAIDEAFDTETIDQNKLFNRVFGEALSIAIKEIEYQDPFFKGAVLTTIKEVAEEKGLPLPEVYAIYLIEYQRIMNRVRELEHRSKRGHVNHLTLYKQIAKGLSYLVEKKGYL